MLSIFSGDLPSCRRQDTLQLSPIRPMIRVSEPPVGLNCVPSEIHWLGDFVFCALMSRTPYSPDRVFLIASFQRRSEKSPIFSFASAGRPRLVQRHCRPYPYTA